MFHPLIESLSHLKDTEIEEKIQSLSRKYFQTHNGELQQQITVCLDIYKRELSVRQSKKWTDEFQKRDKDLDNLINID